MRYRPAPRLPTFENDRAVIVDDETQMTSSLGRRRHLFVFAGWCVFRYPDPAAPAVQRRDDEYGVQHICIVVLETTTMRVKTPMLSS